MQQFIQGVQFSLLICDAVFLRPSRRVRVLWAPTCAETCHGGALDRNSGAFSDNGIILLRPETFRTGPARADCRKLHIAWEIGGCLEAL